MAKLRKFYDETVVPELMEKLELKNSNAVPRIEKITLNMGVGEAVGDKKIIEIVMEELARIAGQKPVVTKARKSVAGFKIREGWPIGVKVTLRGKQMYRFLQRLIDIALTRVRDFRGLNPKSFDGQGNYSLGVKEQFIFPELDYDKIGATRGLDITFTTSAKNDDEGLALLQAFQLPFRNVKGAEAG